jgi:hypothetical protein
MHHSDRPELLERLFRVRGNEASGILVEGLLAHIAAEGERSSLPGDPTCHVVRLKQQTADRVGFTVRAFRAETSHLDEADRIRNPLESLGR